MSTPIYRISTIAFFTLSFTLCAFLIQPIWDTDFWWHIASGKWIVDSQSIPDIDPFQVFSSNDPIRLNTVLHGQWLGQVILFLCYDSMGENGILALRAVIILTCLALLYYRANLLQSETWLTLIYVGMAAIITLGFTGTRPQLFSFLFAAITFFVIDRFNRNKQYTVLLTLPLIAIIWANTHGGVILATVLLFVYAIYTVAETFNRLRSLDSFSIALFLSALFFGLASLITPNGIDTYLYLLNLEGSQLQQRTSEYTSSLALYTLGFTYMQAWIAFFLIISLLGITGLYRNNKGEALISLFLLVVSVVYYRYLAFMLFIAGPYFCLGVTNLSKRFQAIHKPPTEKFVSFGVMAIAVIVLFTGAFRSLVFQTGVNPAAYPVNATAFIKSNSITGYALNFFRWGGYLIWHLHPNVQPFIDGRMLDASRLPPYTHMLWATPQGIRFFEQQEFDLVILPWKTKYSGETYKIHEYLNSQPTWRLIYRDQAQDEFVYRRFR